MTDQTPQDWKDAAEASKRANAEREERSPPYVDTYPVKLTEKERLLVLDEIVDLDSLLGQHEAGKASAMFEWKNKIEEAEAARSAKIATARRGAEDREVRVVDVKILSANLMRVVDADTGEVYFERALDASERQADLFVQDVAAKAAAKLPNRENGATASAPEQSDASGHDVGSEAKDDASASSDDTAGGVTPDVFGGVHDPGDRGDPTPKAPKRARKNKKNGSTGAGE